MNSLTLIDSVLTRSFSTSSVPHRRRPASAGASAPASRASTARSTSSEAENDNEGGGAAVGDGDDEIGRRKGRASGQTKQSKARKLRKQDSEPGPSSSAAAAFFGGPLTPLTRAQHSDPGSSVAASRKQVAEADAQPSAADSDGNEGDAEDEGEKISEISSPAVAAPVSESDEERTGTAAEHNVSPPSHPKRPSGSTPPGSPSPDSSESDSEEDERDSRAVAPVSTTAEAKERRAAPADRKAAASAAAVPPTKASSPSQAAAATTAAKPIPRGPSSVIRHTPKILVLDLDETLIHSTSRPRPGYELGKAGAGTAGALLRGGFGFGWLLGLDGLGALLGLRGRAHSGRLRTHMVEVALDGRSLIYHVYKRPWVDYFLRKVAAWYHVVVYTASVQEYADPVIDWLDQGRGLISGRLFRDACIFSNGTYLKNLSIVDSDLARVCLVDNSPASYLINPANGIPIEGWTHDPNDEALLDLLPVLDSLRFATDVRHILGLRGF